MGGTASEFPELCVFSSGELSSLYPRFQKTPAYKFFSLELIILKKSVMTGIILKHNKSFLERNDKNY